MFTKDTSSPAARGKPNTLSQRDLRLGKGPLTPTLSPPEVGCFRLRPLNSWPSFGYTRLGAARDLVGMEIMQVQLIDQRLLDLLVQDEEGIGLDLAALIAKRFRHVPVDVDRLAIPAVAGEVRNIVLAIEVLDAAQ